MRKRCRPALTSNCLLQRRVTAETVINRVLTEYLDIEEKEYFSLYYLENNHRVSHCDFYAFSHQYLFIFHQLFLDPRKQIKRLMPDGKLVLLQDCVDILRLTASAKQWDLYFGVKFYVHNPDILKQDITR